MHVPESCPRPPPPLVGLRAAASHSWPQPQLAIGGGTGIANNPNLVAAVVTERQRQRQPQPQPGQWPSYAAAVTGSATTSIGQVGQLLGLPQGAVSACGAHLPPDNTIIDIWFPSAGELGLWFGCSSLVGPKTVTGVKPQSQAALVSQLQPFFTSLGQPVFSDGRVLELVVVNDTNVRDFTFEAALNEIKAAGRPLSLKLLWGRTARPAPIAAQSQPTASVHATTVGKPTMGLGTVSGARGRGSRGGRVNGGGRGAGKGWGRGKQPAAAAGKALMSRSTSVDAAAAAVATLTQTGFSGFGSTDAAAMVLQPQHQQPWPVVIAPQQNSWDDNLTGSIRRRRWT